MPGALADSRPHNGQRFGAVPLVSQSGGTELVVAISLQADTAEKSASIGRTVEDVKPVIGLEIGIGGESP